MGLLVAAGCGGSDDDEGDENVSPAEACAHLHELCPGFPVSEDECTESASSAAPQDELDCVGNADSCREAVVDCLGYTEPQYEQIAALGQMGGAAN